jgi:hypothetical protein
LVRCELFSWKILADSIFLQYHGVHTRTVCTDAELLVWMACAKLISFLKYVKSLVREYLKYMSNLARKLYDSFGIGIISDICCICPRLFKNIPLLNKFLKSRAYPASDKSLKYKIAYMRGHSLQPTIHYILFISTLLDIYRVR